MTAEDARPWWASDAEVDAVDPREDPVESTRSARRGPDPQVHRSRARSHDRSRGRSDGSDDRPGDPDRWRPASDRTDGGQADGEPGSSDEVRDVCDDGVVCGACPLCLGWRLLQQHHPDVADHLAAAGRHLADAQPEVAEHLGAAGRHLTAAFRELLDDPDAADVDTSAAVGDPDAAFEHIVLDDEEER